MKKRFNESPAKVNLQYQLTRAEGVFELGMFQEAWNETEELPPIDRTEPLALGLRLRILTAFSQWELGEHVPNVLNTSAVEPARCRETVARFHHAIFVRRVTSKPLGSLYGRRVMRGPKYGLSLSTMSGIWRSGEELTCPLELDS